MLYSNRAVVRAATLQPVKHLNGVLTHVIFLLLFKIMCSAILLAMSASHEEHMLNLVRLLILTSRQSGPNQLLLALEEANLTSTAIGLIVLVLSRGQTIAAVRAL